MRMQYDVLQFVCNKKRVLVLCSNQAHMHHTYRMLCHPHLGAGFTNVLCGLSVVPSRKPGRFVGSVSGSF